MASQYFLACDIGQMTDYSALATLQQPLGSDQLNLVDLVRLPLRTPYPEQVATVKSRMAGLESVARQERGSVTLALDVTGCGRPVYDLMKAVGLKPLAITITAGSQATIDGSELHIPKKDLVSAAQVALQQRRLRVAPDLPEAANFTKEMQNFRYKITLAGNLTAEAWREAPHDDLVLAVAMGCWLAIRGKAAFRPAVGGQRPGLIAAQQHMQKFGTPGLPNPYDLASKPYRKDF